MFMASTLVSPLYVLYQQAFGFSDSTLTLVYAVYVLGNFVGNSAPVIGIGWLSVTLGSVAAISIFAAIIAAVALAALVSLEYALPPRSAHVQGPPAQR